MIEVQTQVQAVQISNLSVVDAESHALKGVDVFLEITLDDSAKLALAKVVAFDDRSKLAVAELTREDAPPAGAALQILRGGRVFGDLVVERVEGKILFARSRGEEPVENGDLLAPGPVK